MDDDINLQVFVNKALTAVAPPTDLDKIFIRGTAPSDKTKGSVGYYDSILVTAYDPAVSVTILEEEGASYSADASWQQVGSKK